MEKTRRHLLTTIAATAGGISFTQTAIASGTPEEWDSGTVYRDGDQVRYGGYEWRAHWYTHGDKPSDTAAVWNRIARLDGTDSYPRWTPNGVYRAGNRVVYEGSVWEANWWTENETPTTVGYGPWKRIKSVESDTDGNSEDSAEDEPTPVEQTPVERHGQLQVIDTELCAEDGTPVQFSGMSTHGIQWYGWDEFLTPDALDALATDWKADLCRIAMYVQEGGYETDPESFTAEVNRLVEVISERGLYAIIDFHILDPGNPLENLDHATAFFDAIAAEHAEKDNVIFEICNEPNNVGWDAIKQYAEEVIPVIRRHDTDSPIVVGTRGWSSLGFADIGADGPQEIVDNPVTGENILYAYHFYAATHGQWERKQLAAAADRLPLFVTECGTTEASGDGQNDFDSAQAFLDILNANNISWAFWSYSDDWRTSGIWTEGTANRSWTVENLTESGQWIRERIRNR